MPARSATSAGSTSSISRISCATSASRRLAPSKRSSARAGFLARGAHRLERGARGAVGVGERGLGLGQPVGGGAARGFRGLDLADQRAALLGEQPRARLRALARSVLASLDARFERRDLRGGAARGARSRPARSAAMAARRRSASSASRASACASARTSASTRALAFDLAAHGGELLLELGGRRAARRARASASLRAARRLVAARGQPRLGLGERREPRGVAARLALGRGMAIARGVGLRAARSRQRVAGGGLRLGGCCELRPRACATALLLAFDLGARGLQARPRCRRGGSSPASRRAAPVGALAAAAKPSQRHRSPSRETRRWPGLSSATRRAAVGARRPRRSARAGAPARGGALTCCDERLDALRQRRIGRDRSPRPPSASARTDRPAHRDRRRARRRARSRSPSRR